MISSILSRLIILAFGTLYPAYCSYKAIRTKNVKEYVRWMMHWVVFSCFVTIETFSDVFLSWFPFYYEVKICIVFWLLSPMTKGSSILYKKFIHPKLTRHEQEIDEYISQAKEKGYKAVIEAGTKTFDYASKIIVETAIKVVTIPHNKTRDVVDHAAIEAVSRELSSLIAPLNLPSTSDLDEPMFYEPNFDLDHLDAHNNYEPNFEFSDVELEQPIRTRTRSQSRIKEAPVPPPEPVVKQKKGVHTIKKSYSLSDLSETDGTTDSFHQEMVQVRHRARPKNLSTSSSISTRSTSLTKRPTSELYFPEVELKEASRRSTGDYSYMRSVDDISSGYSSTMDLSRSELSRTSSNASLRSKRSTRDPMTVSSTLPRRRASEKSKVQRATK